MRNPAFRLFLIVWVGQFLSKVGSGVSAFALGVYVFQVTGSTATYSFLLLAAFLPSILLAPFGGVLADRHDRKKLMIIGDLGSCLGIGFVIFMLWQTPRLYWPLYFGVALSSVCVALHSPSFKALVTDILSEEEYMKAGGLIQLAEASKYLLSPVLAAALLALFSLSVVLMIDMITFLLAAGATALIRGSKTTAAGACRVNGFLADLRDGMTYLWTHATLSRLLKMTMVVTFLTGVLQVLFVPIVLSLSNTFTLGKVQSFAASGMVIGSLVIGAMSGTGQRRPWRILQASLIIVGVSYSLIGLCASVVTITCAAYGLFFALPFVNTSLEVMFRQNIVLDMQGRVWALVSFLSQLGLLVALGGAGLLADYIFNPLLVEIGPLAGTLGPFFGVGPTRGSALMASVFGLIFLVFSISVTGYRKTLVMATGRSTKEIDLGAVMRTSAPADYPETSEFSSQVTPPGIGTGH